MDHLSSFFEKFKKFISTEFFKREIISKIIFTHTGISVDPQQIQIKNQSIYIKIGFVEKNEIFLSKNTILADIKKAVVLGIKDIR